MKSIKSWFPVAMMVFVFSSLAAWSVADTLELKTERFALQFSATGKPASFRTLADGKEWLNVANPGAGFVIRNKANDEIPLTDLKMAENGRLVARTDNATQEVVFRVHPSKTHLGFHIERLKGFPISSDLSLHFEMNVDGNVKVMAADYMTRVINANGMAKVSWPGLWQRSQGDALGAFALYQRANDDDEDDTILRIWCEEGLAHPKVNGEWTFERAKAWVAEWQKNFQDQSRIRMLKAETNEGLYEWVKWAQIGDIKSIYMESFSWRGKDEWWPQHRLNWGFDPKPFPKGEEDVRAFTDFLGKKGMILELHNTSASIGFYDPLYAGPKPDRRFASWGAGRLETAIDTSATLLRFTPDPGTELPYVVPTAQGAGFNEVRPPALHCWHAFDILRIDDEFIRVGGFQDSDAPVWRLENCKRGLFNTKSAPHAPGAQIVGLVTGYGNVFLPDNWSTLLDEMADGYAGMINRCNVSAALFDGIEIQMFFGYGQDAKYPARVYERIDHPTVSLTSTGAPPECWLEYKLNSTRRIGLEFYRDLAIFTHHPSRVATTLLDAHHQLGQTAARKARNFSFEYQCLDGEDQKTHGRLRPILETIRDWKTVSRLLTDEQRTSLTAPVEQVFYVSPTVHELRREKNGWSIVPVRVMIRKEGDMPWRDGRELGVFAPKQYLKPDGQPLKLENPYGPQPVQFIVHVLAATDYESGENIVLQPKIEELKNPTDVRIEQQAQALVLSRQNPTPKEIREEDKFPLWDRKVDMSSRRAIGLWVTGDGKGEILCLQVGPARRDYVVHLDFTGKRYIEIANGEVSAADGFWDNWQYAGLAFCEYDKINQFKIGFGKVPANTQVRVEVEGLKALKEIPAEWANPTIRIGAGLLEVEGNVPTGHYIEYRGGKTATVFDENWHEVKRLNVKTTDYAMPKGWADVIVTSGGKGPLPWLETQFMTEGEPMRIPGGAPN